MACMGTHLTEVCSFQHTMLFGVIACMHTHSACTLHTCELLGSVPAQAMHGLFSGGGLHCSQSDEHAVAQAVHQAGLGPGPADVRYFESAIYEV